jgi:hypothetical protein
LQRSAWKNARYQWFGFRRKGWLPLQGIRAAESVHFSMPVRVRRILTLPALYTLEIESYSYGRMPGLEQNLTN